MVDGVKQLTAKPRGKPWPKGVSGNPKGRPRGAMNKLSLAVNPQALAVKGQGGPEQSPLLKIKEAEKFDPRRLNTHTMHKIGGVWRRTIEQDGLVFDRDFGTLIDTEKS